VRLTGAVERVLGEKIHNGRDYYGRCAPLGGWPGGAWTPAHRPVARPAREHPIRPVPPRASARRHEIWCGAWTPAPVARPASPGPSRQRAPHPARPTPRMGRIGSAPQDLVWGMDPCAPSCRPVPSRSLARLLLIVILTRTVPPYPAHWLGTTGSSAAVTH